MLHFLNEFVNDIKTDTKIYKYVIIASLDSETSCKLINRISGLHLLISSLPGLALRKHVKSLDKVSKGEKIRNRYNQVQHLTQDTNGKVTNSRCQQAFSKPCLINLISKDTYLVFSIYTLAKRKRIIGIKYCKHLMFAVSKFRDF